MSWLSTGIFAGIGFAVGGPIGAGIGALLGSSIGNNTAKITPQEENQTLFFVCLFSMLSKMAIADGVVVKQEINAVKKFMASLKLDAQDQKSAIQIFRNAKTDNYSIYQYASQYKDIANRQMREILYQALWEVALSDGTIHETEDKILKEIPSYLGINHYVYDDFSAQILGNVKKDVTQYYQLLNCEQTDSDTQIKKAYRRAIQNYHPDKIQSKGLPETFIKFANEQTKKINEAYHLIKQSRGI